MTGKSPPLEPVPLQMVLKPGFRVPADWLVEEKPRFYSPSNPGRIDRYYIEPNTGKKFRSVAEVQRYLMDRKTDMSTPEVSKEACDKSDASLEMQMQLIPLTTRSTSDFVLPDGWRIEGKRRTSGLYPGMIDKYYIELKTGKKFRSMTEVRRYLLGGEIAASTRKLLKDAGNKSNVKDAGNESNMQITPFTTGKRSNFILPDGWITEQRKRRNDSTIDRYYIEQATGLRFRSLIAVEKYLQEKEEEEYAMPLKAFKRPNRHHLSCRSASKNKNVSGQKHSTKVASGCLKSDEDATMPKEVTRGGYLTLSGHSDTPQKSNSGEKAEASVGDFACPPSTVNWVLAGPGGDMWSPFVDESIVPEFIKQMWSETFISSLHGD